MMSSTMDLRTWLDGFVCARGRGELPDGRPLYAWRCTDAEYEELCTLMRPQFAVVERSGRFVERDTVKLVRLYAALCLYAAEAWRRTHEGGRWRWQTVLAEVGVADGWLKRHYQVLTGAIGIGLEYWQRPLLRLNGTHEYLLTVACEGGLPLRLLEHNRTRLRAYFLSLQDEARRRRLDDAAALACLASQLRDRLPPSLRQEVVFQLAGRLIAAVEKLHPIAAGAADPLARLDAERPAWRDTLPLTLADGPLRALLGYLLERPASASSAAALHWFCTLGTSDGTTYTPVRRLVAPPTVTGGVLADWLRSGEHSPDAANLQPRYRLLIERDGGTAALALVTRLRGSGEQALYRLELTASVPEYRGEAATGRMPRLYLLAGDSRPLPVAGADDLSELPWVYSDSDVDSEARWLGTGTVRVRAASALVALPAGYTVSGTGVEALGRLAAPTRELLRVAGELRWCSPDGEIGRVLCADPQAGREGWRLCGPTLTEARNARPVYLGLPRLQCAGEDGGWTNVSGSLEWRLRPGAEWRCDPAGCRGRVQVRWHDADGELRFRATIDVLPATATLRFAGSSVWLDGLGTGWMVRPVPTSGAEVCIVVGDGGVECRCTVTAGSVPPLLFDVDLDWPTAERLTLTLPFPLQGGVFTYLGVVQRSDAVVSAGRLGAVTLEVQGDGGHFLLEGELSAEDCDADLQHLLWFRHDIPLIAGGRGRVNLEEFGGAIARLFGATQSLDAIVRLQLLGKGQQLLARLQVARFGWRLEPDNDARLTVRLLSDGGAANAALAQRLILEALPLWEPERQPVPIDVAQPGVWQVAEALTEPGPWLLIARDGDWRCVRPLLWPVRAAAAPAAESAEHEIGTEVAADSFTAVVRSPGALRAARYADLYSAMAGNPAHSAWPAVEALLALGRELPPSTFDACRHLVAVPETLITALLRATDANFDAIWSLADALPFTWTLLPVADWHRAAARAYAVYARMASPEVADMLLADFCARLAARGPVAEVMADWLRRELLGQVSAGRCLAMAVLPQGAAMVRQLLDSESQSLLRERGEIVWPQAPRALENADALLPPERRYAGHKERRAVLCAPFVGVALARAGQVPAPALGHELRLLRDFAPEWFDRASAFALCLELAAFHPARPDATA